METVTDQTQETNTTTSNLYGHVKDGKIYLKGYYSFGDRQIGEVKISPEATFQYFIKRFEVARSKVDELYQLVEDAQNKGSYLMKLIHLREYLANYDGLGDFPALFARLDALEEQLREQVAVNRIKNLEIKRVLLEEAAIISENTDWKNASDLFKELKLKWIKTGMADREMEEHLEAEFQQHLQNFFDRRKAYFEDKIKTIKDRVYQYNGIIFEAIRLRNSQDWDAAADTFKKLHERWKNIGKIPHKTATKLWQKFREANDAFFEKYKAAKGLPAQYKKRVDPKVQLQENICGEIEGLLDDTNIETAADKTKALMMKWRDLAIPPKMQDKVVLERYRMACDKIFETNYLVRVIKRKHFDYEEKPLADRLRIKTAVMADLVRKDKSQLEYSNYDTQSLDREAQTRIAIQKRKISVKEKLLEEYKKQLTELLPQKRY
ncbi:MAG: DUF349 domain-containing protein [Verrucomicrobia bacterium]|nr:DUF349 domain-containing protein [Cytophagales bacterium]